MTDDHVESVSPLGIPSPFSLIPEDERAHQASPTSMQLGESLNENGGEDEVQKELESSIIDSEPATKLVARPLVLTASAVLSRSGQIHSVSRVLQQRSVDQDAFSEPKREPESRIVSGDGQGDTDTPVETSYASASPSALPPALQELWSSPSNSDGPQFQRRPQRTSSAIEAIGTLFLHRDSVGPLDQLSLQRNTSRDLNASDNADTKISSSLTPWNSWAKLGRSKYLAKLKSAKQKTKAHLDTTWHETPPTPVAMPGSYMRDFDDSLSLPPPLLDESSDSHSFEGLLGIKRLREQQQRQQRLDSLRERNRPMHRTDVFTAFSNFVRSAQASDSRMKDRAQLRSQQKGTTKSNPRRRHSDTRPSDSNPESLHLGDADASSTLLPSTVTENAALLGSEGSASSIFTQATRPYLRRHATADAHCGRANEQPLSGNENFKTNNDSNDDATRSNTQEKGSDHDNQPGYCDSFPHGSKLAPRLADDTANEPSRTPQRMTPNSMLNRPKPSQTPVHSPSSLSHTSSDPGSVNQLPVSDIYLQNLDLSLLWVVLSYIISVVTFMPDFIIFFLAHSLDFLVISIDFLSQVLWFLRWLWLNISGRTVLGQCFYEAYKLFQSEWGHVAREDHEARGERNQLQRIPILYGRQGLSALQVVRGLVELACVQAVTRERYHREGAGLTRLKNWQRSSSAPPTPAMEAHDQGDLSDEDEEGYDLVVTSRTRDIFEMSRTASQLHGEDPSSNHSKPDKRHGLADALWDEDNAAKVKNIKWASQLAISAYGLQVLIVDMPPVFTPSGRQFPQQTFAHLSRLNADDVLHADIQNLDDEATYSPTFYIVRDMQRKVVCVAVRGTQSFADIVVDLDLRTEDITSLLSEWRGVEIESDSERFTYHAGMWRAACLLVQPKSTLFCKLRDILNEHPDFGLVFVGHSLGGAIASAAAILLSEYHLDDSDRNSDPTKGAWRTSRQSGLPEGRRIRAITFAHPSTVSNNLAMRTSLGQVPLVTTVILGSDIIPRFGHGQVRELRRVLGALTRVRRRKARVSSTISSNRSHMDEHDKASVRVLRSYWDWRSICRNDMPDSVMLARKKHIEDAFWRLRCEVEDDLYSQAKFRFDQAQIQSGAVTSPWITAQDNEAVSLQTLSQRRQRLDVITLSSETALGGPLVPAGKILWLDKGELYDVSNSLSFFSLPDLQASMFLDHFPVAYEEAIIALGRSGL
ncbi:hypothetical protein MYAM1_000383 [Malassezia yamatoensis]|uniref:sn-1-specific diacylglycerol lipase n=1 Tax=Malassezia yamatoensis TaxID=253288 RepID=A0AAJ6CFE6_9BASI|nr:hypothetical protein MYAM1_000383 [Malassezia yamatoensis]